MSEPVRWNGTRSGLILAGLFPAICLLPFLNKAFHLDDPLFLWLAERIQENPIRFFDFEVNWDESARPMHEITMNPPGAGYFLAGAALAVGWSEMALHAVFLLPAVASGVGIYVLAAQLCGRPLQAVAIAVLSPVFLISSTNVMSDTLLLSLFVWPVALWMIGMRNRRWTLLCMAQILVSAGILVKYMEITLVPLLIVYTVHEERRLTKSLLWFLVPMVTLASYHFATLALFGKSMILGAAQFASEHSSESWLSDSIMQGGVGLAFAGGCFGGTVFLLPYIMKGRTALLCFAVSILAAAAILLTGRFGSRLLVSTDGFRWGFYVQAVVWTLVGIFLLTIAIADFVRRRSADSLLLALWFGGIVIFAAYVNWTINGRTLLAAAPAIAILLVRRLEAADAKVPRTVMAHLAAAALGFTVAWGDYALAGAGRQAAATIAKDFAGADAPLWFQGHWGFQYYMEKEGLEALDQERSGLRPGDVVVVPENSPSTWELPEAIAVRESTIEVRPSGWASTMHRDAGAGFYSHFWGPLPFTFGSPPPERYEVYRIRLPDTAE